MFSYGQKGEAVHIFAVFKREQASEAGRAARKRLAKRHASGTKLES
jgi:hypothetical protein